MFELPRLHFPKIWGDDDWIASTHPDGCQADFARVVGDYPLLVKVIQANDTLSVQVHPDDMAAKQLEGADARGKTECWYILDAEPHATLVYGLRTHCTQEELERAIAENRLERYLNQVEIHRGDFVFIPAGTIHAIGGGMRMLEVQQSSNITYRLYDWGRPRELHIQKGLASVKQTPLLPIAPLGDEFTCDFFTLQKVHVQGEYAWRVPADDVGATNGVGAKNSAEAIDGVSAMNAAGAKDRAAGKTSLWQLAFVADGSGTISATAADGTQTTAVFQKEQIFALAPGENITLKGKGEIIKIVPHRA